MLGWMTIFALMFLLALVSTPAFDPSGSSLACAIARMAREPGLVR